MEPLLFDDADSRGKIPETNTDIPAFCSKICIPIARIPFTISMGVSFDKLLVPQFKITCLIVFGNLRSLTLHRTFCTWSPPIPQFMKPLTPK